MGDRPTSALVLPDLPMLPVSGVLPALGEALAKHRRAVLVAPPGSGKTTLVPPWLLASGMVPRGEILMLQPRRVAARSVARFIAAQRREEVGRTVGYQVRFETRASAETRIRVVTEGILTRRLQGDPSLEGVAAVILDEFHERSVHADLALALLKEVQEALRDDLLILVMSATLDAEPIARFLGHCPIVVAEGRVHPIETHFSDDGDAIVPGARPHEIEARMVRATLDAVELVEAAHREAPRHRDVLGFLPGVRLIEGTRALLAPRLDRLGWDVAVLHGSLDPREQDRALAPGPRPRVVLATNIAETSLTIPGVGAVVDSGLAKVVRYDLAVGSERLETTRIARASADQRRGRAGRLGPGIAVRLWTRFEDDRLRAFEDPEIRRIDLMRVLLELYAWGADPHRFGWFEAPEARAIEDAERRLIGLGALHWKHATRALTPLGRSLTEVAASPRVAAFLHAAVSAGADLGLASRWAATLEEGLADGELAAAVTRLGARPDLVRAGEALVSQVIGHGHRKDVAPPRAAATSRGHAVSAVSKALLAGFADRVGARQSVVGQGQAARSSASIPGAKDAPRYALVGGRMGELMVRSNEASPEAAPDYLIAVELEGGRRGEGSVSRILAWQEVDRAWLDARPETRTEDELLWDAPARRVVAFRTTFFMDLPLDRRSIPNTDRERSGKILAEAATSALDVVFGGASAADESLIARLVTFGRLHDPTSGALPEDREGWLLACLPAMAEGLSSMDDLARRPAVSLREAARGVLGWERERRMNELLPEHLDVPSGSSIRLEYRVDGPPILAVKVQEVFGLAATPTVAKGRLPVVMHLLSPAGRPLQVTTDLASFWTRTWPAVRSEMRTRYPKHHWPEDPAKALPSVRTTAERTIPD